MLSFDEHSTLTSCPLLSVCHVAQLKTKLFLESQGATINKNKSRKIIVHSNPEGTFYVTRYYKYNSRQYFPAKNRKSTFTSKQKPKLQLCRSSRRWQQSLARLSSGRWKNMRTTQGLSIRLHRDKIFSYSCLPCHRTVLPGFFCIRGWSHLHCTSSCPQRTPRSESRPEPDTLRKIWAPRGLDTLQIMADSVEGTVSFRKNPGLPYGKDGRSRKKNSGLVKKQHCLSGVGKCNHLYIRQSWPRGQTFGISFQLTSKSCICMRLWAACRSRCETWMIILFKLRDKRVLRLCFGKLTLTFS